MIGLKGYYDIWHLTSDVMYSYMYVRIFKMHGIVANLVGMSPKT